MLETWELPHIAGNVTTNKVGKTYFIVQQGGVELYKTDIDIIKLLSQGIKLTSKKPK